MSLYLDASALVPTLVKEGSSENVTTFLLAFSDDLAVSDFAAMEVSSALSRLVRTRFLSGETADELLRGFDSWRVAWAERIEIGAADFALADLIVRRFDLGLRAPDALHLAVCRRADHTLVTLDFRLVAAAAELGVSFNGLV